MNATRLFALGFAAALLAPTTAHAGGFAIAEQSVSAGGTAGAGTARSDDPSGAWYNPAALADGAGVRFGAGLIAAMSSLEARGDQGDWEQGTDNGVAPLPSLHGSFAQDNWAAGISLGLPYAAGVSWPEDWRGRHEITASRLLIVRAAPFVAWRFGQIRIAGGLHVDMGEMRLSRSLDFVDAEGDVDLALRGQSIGAHLALFTQAYRDQDNQVDVGLTYKSRSTMDLSGEADFTSPDAFSMKTADQTAQSSLNLPDRFAAGVAWQRGRLIVMADAELYTWQRHREIVIDFARDETPDVVQATEWNPTLALRAGVEWHQGQWIGRGGLFRDPSPAPSDRLSPSSPDANRTGLSVGLGRVVGRDLALDAFYSYLHLARRDGENPDSMAASYGGRAHLLGLGLRYQR